MCDAALVENLERARLQPTCTRAGEVLVGAPLDNGNVDASQGQFARQHQPGRTCSNDHYRMFDHRHSPVASKGPQLTDDTPACCKSPDISYSQGGKEPYLSAAVDPILPNKTPPGRT